jgi:hypothetical protein
MFMCHALRLSRCLPLALSLIMNWGGVWPGGTEGVQGCDDVTQGAAAATAWAALNQEKWHLRGGPGQNPDCLEDGIF